MVATRLLVVVPANYVLSTPVSAACISGVVSKHGLFVCRSPPCNLEKEAEKSFASTHQSTRLLRRQGLLCKPCLYLIPASRTFSHSCSSLILMHSIIYDNASKTLSTLLGIRIYFPFKNTIQHMPLLKLTSASRGISAPMANFPSSHRPPFQSFSAPLDR